MKSMEQGQDTEDKLDQSKIHEIMRNMMAEKSDEEFEE